MKCPACFCEHTKVLDTRTLSDGLTIRRRRECEKCQFRFSTHEELKVLNMTVVKRDGTREPYSKSKIERGLRRALEKRPVTDDQMMQLLTVIEQDIQLLRVEEVSTEKIGEIVIRRLRDVDLVAYIRFASVYKSFNDLTSFKSEIEKIY